MARLPSTTKRTLIDAAHDLIWANSYAHVSVEDICRKAGVQKGSFYHFFASKAELAAAALEDHWLELEPKLEAIVSTNKTPRAQLRALCREILAKQQTALETTGMVCGCPYVTVGSEISSSNADLRTISCTMSDRICSYLERILRHGARDGLIPARGIKTRAQQMHIYIIGAMMQARITNRLEAVGAPLEAALLAISGLGAAR